MTPDIQYMHAHPIMMSVVPFFVLSVIIMLVITGRWMFSRDAWEFHPGGREGFFNDEFVRLGAIFFPYAALMVIGRYYIYQYHPELMHSPWLLGALLSIIVFRRLAGFIPPIRQAGKRIDAARKAAKAKGAAA
jgi:hypothetical protein